MQPGVPLGRPENLDLQQLLAHYDGPAYIRRGRRVQEALDQLLARCRTRREEWLELVRIHLATLHALLGGWGALDSLLPDLDQREALRQLHEDLQPRLRVPVEQTKSRRRLRFALADLATSLERFNDRWRRYLEEVDLAPINEARDGYNRFYLLEKECAIRNGNLARRGFVLLKPFTQAELAKFFPPLPVPRPNTRSGSAS